MGKAKKEVFKMSEFIKCEKLNYHILDSMADWVRVIDRNGKVLFANKTMRRDLGENILYKACDINCKENMKPKEFCGCTVVKSIKNGKVLQKEGIINNKNYSIKASPIFNKEEEIVAAVEVFRDVTRERTLEEKLKVRDKKINKELGLAKRIQNKILPNIGEIENLYIDYIYRPSEVLSGDMFDIFKIDEDNIGIYVSDVAGHGISASMVTMFIRQSMRFIKDDILSPAKVLSELHKRFNQLNLESYEYLTIFYGVFNKNTSEFRYANAGHNSIPIKYNLKSDGIELLEISGYPIFSLFENIDYKENVVSLEVGDRVLLYTDGITERKDDNGKEFGLDSLIAIVEKHGENILEEVEKMTEIYGENEDDFAMVMMEVLK